MRVSIATSSLPANPKHRRIESKSAVLPIMDSNSSKETPIAAPDQAPCAATPPDIAAPPPEQAPTRPLPPIATPASATDDDRFYARVFALAATAILGAALYQIIAPFLGPMMWALFIAFLLHPLHVRIARRFKNRENLSAALLTIGTFVLLIGPLTAMSAAFVAQAGDLVQWAQATLAKQTQQQYRVLTDLPIVGPILQWTRDNFGLRTAQIQSWIAQGTQHLPQLLAGLGGQLFLGAINTVFAFIVMLFMLFFFVRDGAKFVGLLRDLVPMEPKKREQLVDHVSAVTRAVVFGTGMTALVQGALVGIAFLITSLSSPIVFGVIAALLALLPFGGTAIVWLPAVFVLGSQDRWGMAIVMIIFGVMSSSVDNVLRPMLISGRAEVGTLTVFIGVLGGTAAFGPIGLFLGPVVLALIIALMRFAQDQRRAAR
jgi:predicted PurR-regulated permease PerM